MFLCRLFAFENIPAPSEEEAKIDIIIETCKNQKEKVEKLERFAVNAYKDSQYDLSLCAYNRLLSFENNNKKNFNYYMTLGDIYCLKNNYFFGMEMYQRALSIYKKNEEVNIRIANLYLRSNMYEFAQKFFNNVLKNNKRSIDAKKGLGDLFYLQNDYQKAIFYYEQIDFFHSDKDIILKVADCYNNLNKIDKTIEILEKYTKDNKSFDILFLLGKLYIQCHEYSKAKEIFLNLYEKHKYNFKVCLYLANVYYLLDEISLSKHMLELSYKINPSYSVVDILQAQTAYKLGCIDEAKKYAKCALGKAKTAFLREQAQKCLNFLQEK
jgi:tetratricopeptide (TPR) repeat protein